MPAKLLEFYGLSLNDKSVIYFLMTKSENKMFKCDIDFATPNMLVGVIFGAQQSMIARGVTKSVLLSTQGVS